MAHVHIHESAHPGVDENVVVSGGRGNLGFFDSEENVESYIKMVAGEDGAALVDVLTRHADKGATLLELGMGPGTDLAIRGLDRIHEQRPVPAVPDQYLGRVRLAR